MHERGDQSHHAVIQGLLASARRQVGVDVAYLTEYGSAGATIRFVAGDGTGLAIREGGLVSFTGSACLAAVTGRVAAVVPDTRDDRATRRLAWQAPARIGAFAAVPVRLPDGRLFGALCVANGVPVPLLGPATQQFLAAISDVVADQLGQAAVSQQIEHRERQELLALLDGEGMRTVLQPIIDLRSGATLGVEALTRFDTTPVRPPDLWFAAAARHDLGTRMEARAIERALPLLERLPADWYLSVNASPELVESGALAALVPAADADRVVVELTEHAAVADYVPLNEAVARLRASGVRVAVDDAGAGFSTLRHVLELRPDLIKVDGSLIRGIDVDPMHRAMAESILGFAAHGGATVVAEAVETPSELRVLQELGVPAGQGYLFAAPGRVADLRPSYPVMASNVRAVG